MKRYDTIKLRGGMAIHMLADDRTTFCGIADSTYPFERYVIASPDDQELTCDTCWAVAAGTEAPDFGVHGVVTAEHEEVIDGEIVRVIDHIEPTHVSVQLGLF